MHIAFSVVRGLRAVGGIEKYTSELGARLVARGHQVTVFSMARYGVEPRSYRGMNVVPCCSLPGKFGEKLTAGASAAIHILNSSGFDIVHQHSIAAGAFNWLAGLPRRSVLQMHGIEWCRTKWGPTARAAVRTLERIAVAQYRHWTAVSRTQCRILSDRYGISPVYIPTAAEIRPAVPCDAIRCEHGLEYGSFVLFAGRLVPEKGAHSLIDAFRSTKTDLRLVIAGDAPTEALYVRSLKARAQGDPRILFLGTVRGRKLEELFSNCYLYVQPSIVEGLSLALLEAMSYGRCCIVSDIDENREAIDDTGLAFRSEDSGDLARLLQIMLRSQRQVQELGEAARARVRSHYSWDLVTSQMEELYYSMQRNRNFVRSAAVGRY